MHPYRDVPMPPSRRPEVNPEDLVLYGLLVVIGLIPVVIAVIERVAFGFDATLGLMMVVVGVVGWVVHVSRARRNREA
jgi:hypothetical protein